MVLEVLAEYLILKKLDFSKFELYCILGYCWAFISWGSGWNQGSIWNDGYWQKREDKPRRASCWITKTRPADSWPWSSDTRWSCKHSSLSHPFHILATVFRIIYYRSGSDYSLRLELLLWTVSHHLSLKSLMLRLSYLYGQKCVKKK